MQKIDKNCFRLSTVEFKKERLKFYRSLPLTIIIRAIQKILQ